MKLFTGLLLIQNIPTILIIHIHLLQNIATFIELNYFYYKTEVLICYFFFLTYFPEQCLFCMLSCIYVYKQTDGLKNDELDVSSLYVWSSYL